MLAYNLTAVVLFLIAGGFAGYGHPGTSSTQVGLAACGFAVAGGPALVAGALQINGDTSKKDE